jgi:hypothetical protein
VESPMPMWWTALKDLAIPFIAVLVAVVGWYITAANNKTQADVAKTNAESAKRKNEADVEIAKTNAAMAFLQLYDKVPESEPERRARLVAVSLPILPERSAFELALQNLDHDAGAMQSLFALYGQKSWGFLDPYLGRGPYFKTAEYSPDIDFDPTPQNVLSFLHKNNLMAGLDTYLLDDSGPGGLTPAKQNIFLNYFRFLRANQDENRQEGMNDERRKELVARFLNYEKLRADSKAYVALAAAASFTYGGGDNRDSAFLRSAVKDFWVGLDISRGEAPTEDSLRGYLYRHGLYYRDVYGRVVVLPERDELSHSLIARILEIREFGSLPWERISIIIYSYLAHTPRDTESPFVAFLRPAEGAKLMDMVFSWANSAERRRSLGQALNSLEGSSIFRNLSSDRGAQRHFAEATIRFYEAYYSQDWFPAKVLNDILDTYPDLRPSLHRGDYGFSIG